MGRDVYIFNAGPAVLPEPVLESTSRAVLNFAGTGMSIMEVSHRSKPFEDLLNNTIVLMKKVLGIPDNYKVLFLQGGASLQFSMVPMNLLGEGQVADYIDTGMWSSKAIKEAKKVGKINIAASTKEEKYTRIPEFSELKLTDNAAYCHITSNNTIYGSQWKSFPDTKNVPKVCDMSSDILSRKIDVSDFGLIYAGAQKNAGPAGVTLVIIREDLIGKAPESIPTMLDYKIHAENNSLYNTPPCIGIFVVHEVLNWIENIGGISGMEKINEEKAGIIYDILDSSSFYRGTVKKDSRSLMNIPFRLPTEELEDKFIKEASSLKLLGLKGHRSVGGIRASMYNALPVEGAKKLAELMLEFEKKNS
jgi:phosphoserine aminotransferase